MKLYRALHGGNFKLVLPVPLAVDTFIPAVPTFLGLGYPHIESLLSIRFNQLHEVHADYIKPFS